MLNVVVDTALTVATTCPAMLLADVGPIVSCTTGVPVKDAGGVTTVVEITVPKDCDPLNEIEIAPTCFLIVVGT